MRTILILLLLPLPIPLPTLLPIPTKAYKKECENNMLVKVDGKKIIELGVMPFYRCPRYLRCEVQSFNYSNNAPGRDYSLLGEGHY